MSTDSSFSSEEDDDEFTSTSSTSLEKQQLLKSLHYTVGKICREVEQLNHQSYSSITSPSSPNHGFAGTSMSANANANKSDGSRHRGDEEEKAPRMSKAALSCLTQMTFHYVSECLAPDLVAFSKHAKRKIITVDDVKLVARKNPGGDLLESLESLLCDNQHQQQPQLQQNQQQQRHRNIKNAASSKSTSTSHQNKRKRMTTFTTSRVRKRDDHFDAMGLTQQRDRLLNESESSHDEKDFYDNSTTITNHLRPSSRKRRIQKKPLETTTTSKTKTNNNNNNNTARRKEHGGLTGKGRSSSGSGSSSSSSSDNNNDSSDDNQSDDTDDLHLQLRFQRNESTQNSYSNTIKEKSKIVIDSSSSDDSIIPDPLNKGASSSSQSRNSDSNSKSQSLQQRKHNGGKNSGSSPKEAIEL